MRTDPPLIGVFVTLNWILAVTSGLWLLLVTAVFVYGLFFSGDRGQELVEGVLGCAVLAAPGSVGLVVYAAAAVGLSRRRPWGYYCHIGGALLAALSCIGLVYTVYAMVYNSLPGFAAACFPPAAADPSDWDDA